MVHATIDESNRLSGEIAADVEKWLALGNKIEVVPIDEWEGKRRFNETVNPKHEAMSTDSAKPVRRSKPIAKTYHKKAAVKNHLKGRFFYELRKTMSTNDLVGKLMELTECEAFTDRYSSNLSVINKRLAIYSEYLRSQGHKPALCKSYKLEKRKQQRLDKEKKVAQMLEQGLTYSEIAAKLGCGAAWVRELRRSLLKRD